VPSFALVDYEDLHGIPLWVYEQVQGFIWLLEGTPSFIAGRVVNAVRAFQTRLLPTFLWIALIGGGIITIGFTFLFGLSNTWVHVTMVGLFAAVIVVSLILISDLNYPFAGPGKIDPQAFQIFLARLPPPR
jgi:hypothetical protein